MRYGEGNNTSGGVWNEGKMEDVTMHHGPWTKRWIFVPSHFTAHFVNEQRTSERSKVKMRFLQQYLLPTVKPRMGEVNGGWGEIEKRMSERTEDQTQLSGQGLESFLLL